MKILNKPKMHYGDYGQEVPQQEEGDGVTALNLQWVLGFNKDID